MIARRQIILYLAPAVIFTLLFYLFPLVFAGYTSLQSWNGLNEMVYVGMDNYRLLAGDPVFAKALRNTLTWIASAVLLHIPFGLLLALLLARRPRGWRLLRVLLVLPNVISTTAIAFLWYFVLHVNLGLLNHLLEAVGLPGWKRAWLSDIQTALVAHQLPFILYVGLTMVIFLAQMTTIPSELYEAAEIDGATVVQKDWLITIPLLRGAVWLNILFNVAFCLRMFEYPLLMTGGGPANETVNLSLYMYREMVTANRYGVSMATGIVSVGFGAVVMGLLLWMSRLALRRGSV
ncbi:carbohydrate ABC transporter permease [Paenibacillus sp. SYP-B4298]|uniref:carbohydrate ABC transporter permease n=1 Tax=Paenibacillus sp. SYP-B4298 TaxID=2996034 RepID=UPI0022DD2C77|nr:sugar ABC transporter permease [Paenibacillus sp. SYP-B4298]